MQVAIVKYNAGNIRSVLNALHRCGVGHTITINNNKKMQKQSYVYTVIIATALVFEISSLIGCSDEEWNGTPDYVNTHAPRLTRAGVEGGSVDPYSNFPDVTTIAANHDVKSKMDEAWSKTLDAASDSGRSEFYFFINYDVTTNTISCSEIKQGNIVQCGETGNGTIDVPNSSLCCAYFHTHTTLQYCTSKTVSFSRSTGVSPEDELTANTLGIPGLLYDYKKKTIYGGDSKKMAHKLYTFGPSRKTPPNN